MTTDTQMFQLSCCTARVLPYLPIKHHLISVPGLRRKGTNWTPPFLPRTQVHEPLLSSRNDLIETSWLTQSSPSLFLSSTLLKNVSCFLQLDKLSSCLLWSKYFVGFGCCYSHTSLSAWYLIHLLLKRILGAKSLKNRFWGAEQN